MSDALTQHFLDVDIETDVANGRLLAYLAKHGEILSRTYADDRVSVHCRMPRKFLGQILAGRSADQTAQQRPGFRAAVTRTATATRIRMAMPAQTDMRTNGDSNRTVVVDPAICMASAVATGRSSDARLRADVTLRPSMGRLYMSHGEATTHRSARARHRCIERHRAGAGDRAGAARRRSAFLSRAAKIDLRKLPQKSCSSAGARFVSPAT